MSHSFIQWCCWMLNSASFSSSTMKDLCQKWKVKLIFRSAYRLSGTEIVDCLEIINGLMAWPGWLWSTYFYDRSSPLLHSALLALILTVSCRWRVHWAVSARIAGFSTSHQAQLHDTALLPCVPVGKPQPRVVWKTGLVFHQLLTKRCRHLPPVLYSNWILSLCCPGSITVPSSDAMRGGGFSNGLSKKNDFLSFFIILL